MAAREDIHGDWKPTTLAVQLAAGDTSLSVQAGGLATWTPVTHNRIPVIINRGRADEEHLYAAGVSGDSLTGLTRGQDDTTDQVHAEGATVEHGLFASHIDAANELASLPTAAGQFLQSTGADTWAATAAPILTDYSNAGHDHLDTDDGGKITQAASHESPDTDTATTALHHTLGTGANQATPGTHPAATSTHGVTGAVVGTTDVQTLTNKTLTAPTIGDFTNAQHNHGDADDGGSLAAVAWVDYTPTITGVNPGAGSMTGRYLRQGDLVVVNVSISFGAGMSVAAGGPWAVALPVSAELDLGVVIPGGSGVAIDASTGAVQAYVVDIQTATTARLTYTGTTGNNVVDDFSPWAWTSGDSLRMFLIYEGT